MVYEWNKLSGSVVGQRYVLGEKIAERKDSATFATELPDTKSAVAEIVPGNSSMADVQLHCWSVARGLAHPNLVKIYDAGEENLNLGRFIYAVKERPEECLADVLISRALTEDEARQVVEASLLCLQYLHDNGYAHGALGPSNVLAIDNRVKLAADTVAPSTRSGVSAARDVYSLGVTIVEVLTRKRLGVEFLTASPEKNPIVTALPAPFRQIAMGCLQPDEARRWTPGQGLSALANRASQPHVAPRRSRVGPALVALASVVCAVLLIRSSQRPADAAKRSYDVVHDDRRSPIPGQVSPQSTSLPKKVQTGDVAVIPPPVSKPVAGGADWAVVVATYRDFDMAQRFASSLQGRFKAFACRVSPPRGQADKYYYVVLGSRLTRDAAQRLQQRAIAAGLPQASYVTRITASQPQRH